LKAVDLLDFLLWGLDQLNLGNQFAQEAVNEVCQYLDANPDMLPGAAYMYYRDLRSGPAPLPKQANVVEKAVQGG
jgi:hypothetical protein